MWKIKKEMNDLLDPDMKKPKFTMLIAFGLGMMLVLGLVSGLFNAALTHVSDYRDLGGFAHKVLVVTIPILSASIGMVQGILAESGKKAAGAGLITGGVGYVMSFLGLLVTLAAFSYGNNATDYINQTVSGFWTLFAVFVFSSAIICTLSALSSYTAMKYIDEK